MLKTIEINNYPYEVEITGSGTPTWVFLHGFMGSYADFEKINPQGTCIKINLFGFGKHAPLIEKGEMFHMKHQVDSLAKLFKKLKLKAINLVGYSMGGRLALSLALDHPELIHHLFLEGATAGIDDSLIREQRVAADMVKAQQIRLLGLEQFVKQWEELPMFASQKLLPKTQQKFMHDQRVNHQAMNVINSLRYMGTGSQPNNWPKLPEFKVPVTLIVGAKDTKFQQLAEKMARKIPNSTIVKIADAGHNVHFEKPTQFIEALNNVSN